MVCAVDGGFPLLRDGKVVGSIGVSGMNPTQDAFVAQSGAAALQAGPAGVGREPD